MRVQDVLVVASAAAVLQFTAAVRMPHVLVM